MDKIDGPCENCLVLAVCRNKDWNDILCSCITLRREIWKFGDKNIKNKGKNFKVVCLGKTFHLRLASDKSHFLIGPKQ